MGFDIEAPIQIQSAMLFCLDTLTVCLAAGWGGWVGSNPIFGDGANPFIVWLQL